MSHPPILLKDRGVVEVAGPDASAFLQGLITNDMGAVANGRAIYAALLTPQGKIIYDFLIAAGPGENAFWLDCVKSNAADLAARLKKYKLRAKVAISDRSSDLAVVVHGSATDITSVVFEDPRLPALGRRLITPSPSDARTDDTEYQTHRLALGVPNAATDIPPETLFPLDCNFEELHGVDFNKGCYIGQELTARMKHRATARRRMLPVAADTALPPPGTTLKLGATDIGELRGSIGTKGLALIRLDRLADAKEATTGDITIRIGRPAYPLILPTGDTE